MKTRLALVAGLALCFSAVAQTSTQEATNWQNAQPEGTTQVSSQTGEVVAQQDPMKEWIKANMPGKHHAFLLGNMLGEWNATSKFYMQPNAPAQESSGTCVCTQQMTGRFVQMEHSGEMMGMPFKGLGFFGYNNATGKFENMWMDSSSTGMMFSTGEQTDNAITWTGTYTDPMSKQPRTSKSTTTFVDRNTMKFEMFEQWTDGTEFKTLEITYSRQSPRDNAAQNNTQSNNGQNASPKDNLQDAIERKTTAVEPK